MPVYILCKAQDGWNPDDLMVFNTGFPVYVSLDYQLGGKQVPPKFFQVTITDSNDKEEIEVYHSEWMREIDWEFTAHDFTNDSHTLRAFVKPEFVSTSGLNSLTRNQVENFLNKWNAAVTGIGANEVIFSANVYQAISSEGFWQIDSLDQFSFSEKSYSEATGIHRITIDYSASQFTQEVINAYIAGKGGEIFNNAAGKVTFDIGRDVVFDAFKLDVKEKVDGTFAVRKFKVPEQYVNMALANGGNLDVTRQQWATYIYNRLND